MISDEKEHQTLNAPNLQVHEASSFSAQLNSERITLLELFGILLERWKTIVGTTILFSIIGVGYSLWLPNIYQSSVLLAPAQEPSQMGAMASQLSGLASLAGVSLGQSPDQTNEVAIASLTSRKFVDSFISKHRLLPELMALKKWDAKNNKLIFNSDIYDVKMATWHGHSFFNDSSEPTATDAYKAFKKILVIDQAKNTGFITISIDSQSPYLAKQWAEWLVVDINQWMKNRKIDASKRNIEYLEAQLRGTSVSDMVKTFNKLIEDETKQLMLAEAQPDYAFQIIDDAVVPELKIKPNRALICFIISIFGGLLGSIFVLCTSGKNDS